MALSPHELLPAELFNRVIAFYVNAEGIEKAWKDGRRVCKIFKNYIEFEIFARQPVRGFLKSGVNGSKWRRTLLRRNLSTFLRHRVRKLNGALPFVPNFIRQITNTLERQMKVLLSNNMRNDFAQDIITLLQAKCPYTYTFTIENALLKKGNARMYAMYMQCPPNPPTQLVAAAAVGNLGSLITLVKSRPKDKILEESAVFGDTSALEAAVITQKLPSLQLLLDCLVPIVKTLPRDMVCSVFTKAMEACREGENRKKPLSVELALRLISWYAQHVTTLDKRTYETWFEYSIPDQKIVTEMLKIKSPNQGMVHATVFKSICESESLTMARFFLDSCLVTVPFSYSPGKTVLDIAVNRKNVQLAKMLLDAGALANGLAPPGADWVDSPLELALKSDSFEMVEILLEYGATLVPERIPSARVLAWRSKKNP